MPEVLQDLTDYQDKDGIIPKKLFHDLRSEFQKKRDLLGVPRNTLAKQLNIFETRPTVKFCVEMGQPTLPSI